MEASLKEQALEKLSSMTIEQLEDLHQAKQESAEAAAPSEPMYVFPRTKVCMAVLFIIGIRAQEAAWGLEVC